MADLTEVIDTVIAPGAAEVDRDGTYPRAGMAALAEAGVLGLVSAREVGGGGAGMREAATVIGQLAAACGSTAMVVLMHYAATAIIEAHGRTTAREDIGAGRHLSTLAFSEAGSRSHFWVPQSTARSDGNGSVRLDARKSWVTAAGEADSYVWSSLPLAAEGPMTLWLVPASTKGLTVAGPFDGLGLRGNASQPVTADGVVIPADAILGTDGAGLEIALQVGLPWFLVLSAAFSIGLMDAVLSVTATHLTTTRLEHLGQSLAQQPITRSAFAAARLRADSARALLEDTLSALEGGRQDAMLRVLEVKAAAGEAAADVTDAALKIGGGAAFRKEIGVERRFRDARAARVMAPTTEALLDFVGRALLGLPLIEAPSA